MKWNTQERRHYDCIIIGMNESAIACALELRRAGEDVILLPNEGSPGLVADNYCVGATPLNAHPISGFEFEDLGYAALAQHGIPVDYHFMSDDVIRAEHELGLVFPDSYDGNLSAGSVVWATLGCAPQIPTDLISEGQVIRGFSTSAASDIGTLRYHQVAVIGSGPFSVRQACIATQAADSVKILSAQECRIAFPPCCPEERVQKIEWITVARCVALYETEERSVAGVIFERNGERQTLPAEIVLFSEERLPCWGYWGSREVAQKWIDSGLLFPAAIAADVDYTDSDAMWANGIAVAQAVLSRRPQAA